VTEPSGKRFHLALLLIGVAILAWSAWKPHDYFTWILEVFPAIIAGAALTVLSPRVRFTTLVYVLILVHATILMIGGHYTYAEMPLFSWLRDEFHLARNYYDRLGHVAQGFIPAMIVREILVRNAVVNGRRWLFFIVCSIALAISACYEFFEWWVAVASGSGADAFLATQGDVWDTQWDMFMALCGAIVGQLILAGIHDRQLRRFIQPDDSTAKGASALASAPDLPAFSALKHGK
jgi:putative membrane protein